MSQNNQEPVYGFRKPTQGPIRTPLRKVSKKRAKQNAEYAKKRKAFLEAHPYCQWWLRDHGLSEADVSWNGMVEWNQGFDMKWLVVPRSTEIHHTRGRTGLRLNEEEFWMAVSQEGHNWIHSNPKEAYERGYMIKR